MARTVLFVFLSSTAGDLKLHREAVYARLARIEFIKCIRQEDFGPQVAETVAYCCEKAAGADLFIGLIGLRRGFEPHGDNAKRSITEMEYDAAKNAGRLLWVSPDDFPVPGNLRESAGEYKRQLAFRKRARGAGIVSQQGFASPDALASEIVERLLAHIVTGDLIKRLRADATGSAPTPAEDQAPAVAAAVEKLVEDKDVDLLALARDPKGVDIAELERKLTARAEQHEADSREARRTSAEYWRHIGALAFLHNTAKAAEAYEKAVVLDPDNADGWRYFGELQFRRGDLAGATKSFSALVEHGKRTSEPRAESTGCLRLGWIYRNKGDFARAEIMTLEALQLARGWNEGTARAYANLGIIHSRRGDLDQAEEMYHKALALDKELGSKEGMARAYTNLGNICFTRGDLAEAEEMHRKALSLDEELGSKEGVAADYTNLGVIHRARGDLAEADEMYRKALALHEELGSKEGMARAYASLGTIHRTRGDLAKAEEMHCKSLTLDKELDRKEGMAINYTNLGIIHDTRRDLAKAEEMHRRALALHEEIDSKEGMAAAYANLGNIDRRRGDLAKAEEMHRKALALHEELRSKEGMAADNWNIGIIFRDKGQKTKMHQSWRKARDLWREMGLTDKVAEVEGLLREENCED